MMLCFISYKQHKNETKTRIKREWQKLLCLPKRLNNQGSDKSWRIFLPSKARQRPQAHSSVRASQKKGFYLGGIITK